VTLGDGARRRGAHGRSAAADPVGPRRLEKAIGIGGVHGHRVLLHFDQQIRFTCRSRREHDLRRFHTLHQPR